MDVVILIIASILLVAVIALTIVVINKKPSVNNDANLKEFGMLNQQISSLSESIKKDMDNVLKEELHKADNSNSEKFDRFKDSINTQINNRFDSLQTRLDERMKTMDDKVDQKLETGFKATTETITQVRERLQAIDAAQKNIEDLSKDVVSLKNVLEGNQTRGQYGEYQLSMVLHNVFGDTVGCYEEQYTIKKVKDGNDVRADAVVFMPEPNKMICIDSKFPFADYSRIFEADNEAEKEKLTKEFQAAVKKHITAIKDKYIIDGKTAPEALMFIPNDGVFAFIHHNCLEAVEYAREKKVILTSPSTLAPMLVTINMLRIEVERAKNAKEVSKQIQKLSKDFEMFGKEWNKFSNALESASRSKEALSSRVNKLTGKFEAIKSSESIQEIEEIDESEIPSLDIGD